MPFFIPHEGCPFACVFCSQKKITGRSSAVLPSQVSRTISRYLKTIPRKGVRREVAFFGGSFTALPPEKQEAYLAAVRPFIRRGRIDGIRVSTRPDAIDDERLALLKRYGVTTVELGVQSLADDVLKASKRGHTAASVRNASRLILKRGFTLGHQVMVGLPRSTLAKEIATARAAVRMGAREVRIYPVVVIRGTALAAMWKKGAYKPLSDRQAVARSAALIDIFRKGGVTVLRVGLHPSEGLLSGSALLAGPFHEAFRQKTETYRYGRALRGYFKKRSNALRLSCIRFNPADAPYVIGHGRVNADRMERLLGARNLFVFDAMIPPGSMLAEYDDGKRKVIRKM